MKQQLAAIAFNERELDAYVSALLAQNFEAVSEVKKAEDGTFYQVLARTAKAETPAAKAAVAAEEPVAATA